jgi:Tfp pilus assembly protein PilO
MVDQSNHEKLLSVRLVLALLAVVLVVVCGVYETIPQKGAEADSQPTTAEAFRELKSSQQLAVDQLQAALAQAVEDLKSSQQHAVNQLTALQQTRSFDQAETKRLSEEITALSNKLDVLQQSFARVQQSPSAQLTEPARQSRRTR